MSIFKSLLSAHRLAKSRWALKRKRVEIARSCLDWVLSKEENLPSYVKAYDARVSLAEGNYSEALKKFNEEIKSRRDDIDEDSQYIRKYCDYYFHLADGDQKALEIRDSALKTNPRNIVRRFLPFPSSSVSKKLLNDWPKNKGFL